MKRITIIFAVLLLLGSLFVAAQQVRTHTSARATLSAPGYSSAIYCGGFSKFRWYFTVAAINTKVSLAVQAKGGGSDWTNIWADSLGFTANGAYSLDEDFAALADSLRLRFIAEGGGTNATITHNVVLSGGGD